ncbi:uncharacterized protein LOC144103828 [Amblyomma americanum]
MSELYRSCDVYLCKAPPQDYRSIFMGLCSPPLKQQCINLWHRHWFLAFDYGDSLLVICDVTKDCTGKFTGWKYWKKKDDFNETYPDLEPIGQYTYRDLEVDEAIQKLGTVERGEQPHRNCRHWALELLSELNIKLPAEEDYIDTGIYWSAVARLAIPVLIAALIPIPIVTFAALGYL